MASIVDMLLTGSEVEIRSTLGVPLNINLSPGSGEPSIIGQILKPQFIVSRVASDGQKQQIAQFSPYGSPDASVPWVGIVVAAIAIIGVVWLISKSAD